MLKSRMDLNGRYLCTLMYTDLCPNTFVPEGDGLCSLQLQMFGKAQAES